MSSQNQPRQIFLGNISYDARPQDVIDALRGVGIGAARVRIATYKETGGPRGFGFLDLDATEARPTAEVIQYINDIEIAVRGRVLRADAAKERPPRLEQPTHQDGRRSKKGGRPSGGRGKGANEFQRGRNDFDREDW